MGFFMYFTLNSFLFLAKFAFGFRENGKFLKIMYKCSLHMFVKLFEIFAHIEYFARMKVPRKYVDTPCEKIFQFLLLKGLSCEMDLAFDDMYG
jgi:hypothetical protein